MRCNLIGAGRLGKNIALALHAMQRISSLVICNRTYASAYQACQELGTGRAVANIHELPEAEITWLCCNDDAIAPTANLLADTARLKPSSLVIHSSGVLNSSVLMVLKEQGCSVASLHPLKAFKTNYLEATAFNQVDCIIEGDQRACAWLQETFSKLGAYVCSLPSENKPLYHAAACIASNYLITLAACSEELFLKTGLPSQQARRMLINLMQGNLSNLHNLQETKPIANALTGPIARGDINTIELHLDAIKEPELRHLYQAAGRTTLSLTSLTEEQKETINAVLTDTE